MYKKITDFTDEWIQEMRLTEKVMAALTDESLSQRITSEHRTLGQLAWHLVSSLYFVSHFGLTLNVPEGDDKAPQSAASLVEEYIQIGHALLHAVKTQWDDERLLDTVEIMGEQWANGASLRFIIMHQAHHRGQMTVLMRQAGLRLPEVYGPTYESWLDKGLEPLA